MMTQELPAKYARLTAPEAAALLAMTRDALAEDDNPNADALRVHAAYLERVVALRGGSETALLREDDVTVGRPAGSPTSNQYGTFEVYAATEKQVNFLRKLIDTKDTTGLKIPSTLEGISKTAASALIDKLIDRAPKAGAATPAAGFRAPSDKQLALIRKLLVEKDVDSMVWNPVPGVELASFQDWQGYIPTLSSSTASKAIDALFSFPRKPAAPAVELAAGAYRVGDKIIRVYLGQQSGKMLAAELVDAAAENRDDAWQYLGMASRFVPVDAHRMTAEECEAVAGDGATFSWCCVCGRRLDDPNSVARSIGPVCRAKQGR